MRYITPSPDPAPIWDDQIQQALQGARVLDVATYPVNDISQLDPDEAPETNTDEAEIDVLSDWIETLRLARHAMKIAKEREDEAKKIIESFLAAQGAQYGLVNGQRVVHARPSSRTYPPSLKTLREVAPEIAEAHSFTREYITLTLDPR